MQFTQQARELLSDFREVEHNFRQFHRSVRERIAQWDGKKGELLETIILETAVGSRKYAQAINAPGKFEKALITNKVTTSFSILPCTSISCISVSRPTAVSRIMGERDAIAEFDQGNSFQAFWGFLMPPQRQEQFTAMLDQVLELPAIVHAPLWRQRTSRTGENWIFVAADVAGKFAPSREFANSSHIIKTTPRDKEHTQVSTFANSSVLRSSLAAYPRTNGVLAAAQGCGFG